MNQKIVRAFRNIELFLTLNGLTGFIDTPDDDRAAIGFKKRYHIFKAFFSIF